MNKQSQNNADEALELALYSVDLWQFSWEQLDFIDNWIEEYVSKEKE